MRKVLAAGVALMVSGFAGPVMAADLEVEPAYKAPLPVVRAFSWSGFYLGGNVGGHWGNDEFSTATDPGFAAAAVVDAVSVITLHPRGFEGGVQAGYNWAGIGGVWGIEVDANWLGGTASRTLPGIPVPTGPAALSDSAQATFLSTFRMRWGIPYDRALFFATAGFAVGTLKTPDTFAQAGLPAQSVSSSTTKAGLAVGGGIDYAFTDSWSARLEYLYIALQNVQPTIPATPGNLDGITVTHKYSDSIARFALNYRFVGSGM
jgi:outer membrane immunogenic protein